MVLSPAKNYTKRHAKQLDKLTEVDIIKVRLSTYLELNSVVDTINPHLQAELEEKAFKVKLTVIDTPGFGDYVNNR
ncbi:Septin spn4 [Marasmius tenuissimus]|uniref:Septin spn4 n=1 Tax=Marasmius tenuissimus TaxID=585030 RepID=A0ABR2ZTN0_9AGAR